MNRKKIVAVNNSVSVRKKMLTLTLTLTLTLSVYALPWGEPVIIDSGPSNAYRTDIAFDRNGNAISVFEQKTGNLYRVFANYYKSSESVSESVSKDKNTDTRTDTNTGWQGAVPIDSGIGNAYRGQVAFDREGNAIAVFKQEIAQGRYRIYASRYQVTPSGGGEGGKGGWQSAVPIDNGGGKVDGQDIVFDSEGNAAVVFEEHNGKEFGIYVNFYSPLTKGDRGLLGWHEPFRIDGGTGNAYFPYAIFDDKGNLYVVYYKESPLIPLNKGGKGVVGGGLLDVYVSWLQKPEVRSQKHALSEVEGSEVISQKITYGNIVHKEEKWAEKKSEVRRGIMAVYNPMFLSELKNRIYSGNYSYSRWETPSKLDARFRDAYRPTLLFNGNGDVTALFVKWDGEYLSAYAASYRNGKWGKPEEIDAGKGDVEHIRGAVNSKGEMAVVWTQWVDGNLRIHARIKNSVSDSVSVSKDKEVSVTMSVSAKNTYTDTHTDTFSNWGEAKIIDAGKKDAYNPNIIFTDGGEIIAVWCQWEKANVKSYSNIYRKEIGWGSAERLENEDGETCGVKIASGTDGKIIAIFEQEEQPPIIPPLLRGTEGVVGHLSLTNRIFAVEFVNSVSVSDSVRQKNTDTHTHTYTIKRLTSGDREDYYSEFSPDGKIIVFVSKHGKYSNLYIMDAEGKNIRQLTFPLNKGGEGVVMDTAPVWTSDGERIIFASNRVAEAWDIWSIRPDGSELTRITKLSRNEYSPRPTADGKNILFVSTAGGDHAIWSMDINGENQRRLTSGGTGDWFPAMNPNGSEVVFVSTRLGNGDIWTIDSAERKYHRLTYTELPEFSPAWSPDGSKIAYVTNKGGEFDIWIMDRDGKNKRQLTKGISNKNWGSRFSSIKIMETAGYYHLSWHPDGTKLLFTEWADNEKESYISMLEFDKEFIDRLEVDNTPISDWTLIGERELTAGEWEDFGPSFSPDGRTLTFSSNRSGNWDIWSMEFNGEDLRQLTKGDDNELAPVYSPDGKEIAYLKKTEDKKIRSLEDEKLKSTTSQPLNFSTSVVSTYDLWIMNSDGSGARQITPPLSSPPLKGGEWGGVISYPAWHPNGNELAFVSQGTNGYEILVYNLESKIQNSRDDSQLRGTHPVDGSHNLQSYPFKKFLYRIGYNPAGDKITFESNVSGNAEIWTMRSDGTNIARITKGDSPHWNPIWSPDGKMIAYTTDKLGEEAGHHNWRNYNIWVADTETQKEMLITGEEQIDWNPVWSPDGKKIVYVTNRSGEFKHFSLWVLYLK